MEQVAKLHQKILKLQRLANSLLEKSKDVQIGGKKAYSYVPITDMVLALIKDKNNTVVDVSITSSVSDYQVEWTEKGARVIILGETTVTDLETGFSQSFKSIGMSAANGDKAVDIATTFMKRNALKQIFHAHGVDELEEYNEEMTQTTKRVNTSVQSKRFNISFSTTKSNEELRDELKKQEIPNAITLAVLTKLGLSKLSELDRTKWATFVAEINNSLRS